MNVLLYGPPGIGKSTLIKALADLNLFSTVIDLEDLPPSEWYLQRTNAIVGMAGVHPSHPFESSIKVLLYMDEDGYADRRHLRDSNQPSKADQRVHHMSEWLTLADYDFAVNVSGSLPSTLHKLSAICSLTLV